MNQLYSALLEGLVTVVLTVSLALVPIIAAALVMGVKRLGVLVGVSMSAQEQATLHSAIVTGLSAGMKQGLTGKILADYARDWVKGAGAGDTVAKMAKSGKLMPSDLSVLIASKMKELGAE